MRATSGRPYVYRRKHDRIRRGGHCPPAKCSGKGVFIKRCSHPGCLGREHNTPWCHPNSEGEAFPLSDMGLSARRMSFPGLLSSALSAMGCLSGKALNRYCFRVCAGIIAGSSCFSSSCASRGRRAASRGSAFPPRRGLVAMRDVVRVAEVDGLDDAADPPRGRSRWGQLKRMHHVDLVIGDARVDLLMAALAVREEET